MYGCWQRVNGKARTEPGCMPACDSSPTQINGVHPLAHLQLASCLCRQHDGARHAGLYHPRIQWQRFAAAQNHVLQRDVSS